MSAPKKKKGLSLEEKREIMLNICLESKDVFNLKDLEKLGSKAGVVLQTVKDVVQSLTDDRMVEVDKIGSGNFYWAFPSKAFMGIKNRAEHLEASVASETAAIAELEKKLATLQVCDLAILRGSTHAATMTLPCHCRLIDLIRMIAPPSWKS
jgi:Fe2+ or Zn2+ uptake regulation protein